MDDTVSVNLTAPPTKEESGKQASLQIKGPEAGQVMKKVLDKLGDRFDPKSSIVTIEHAASSSNQQKPGPAATLPAFSKHDPAPTQRQAFTPSSAVGYPSYTMGQQQQVPGTTWSTSQHYHGGYTPAGYRQATQAYSLQQSSHVVSRPTIKEVDGVIYEVIYAEKIVPRTEVQYMEKIVPRYEVQYVEKVVEVPEIQYIEELRPIPKVEVREWSIEVPYVDVEVVHVPKKVVQEHVQFVKKPEYQDVVQVIEVPKTVYVDRVQEIEQVIERPVMIPKVVQQTRHVEVVKHVPKIEIRQIEKIVQVPVIQEVPKPYIVEVPTQQLVFNDVAVPVVVGQKLVPIMTNDTQEEATVEVKQYVPYIVPVDVYIPRPVQLPLIMGKVDIQGHYVTGISVAHWNGLVNKLNPQMLQDAALAQYLPWLYEQDGTNPAVASPPLVEPIVPASAIGGYNEFMEYLKTLQIPLSITNHQSSAHNPMMSYPNQTSISSAY